MKNEPIRIAVAESSVIVRSGVLSVLRHMSETSLNIHPIEVASMSALQNCMQAHKIDILIINPTFEGWFNIDGFKADEQNASVKYVALICTITDQKILQKYDESMNLFDDAESLYHKIVELQHLSDEDDDESETLSQREKEIIKCIVKGMTNKEIAEKLYISIHTVITHRRNLSRKLQIHSPAGLTIYAIVNKLVELDEVKM